MLSDITPVGGGKKFGDLWGGEVVLGGPLVYKSDVMRRVLALTTTSSRDADLCVMSREDSSSTD